MSMEFFRDYIKEIIGFVVICQMISGIFPNKNMGKYIRFVIGLIIIGLLIRPIFDFSEIYSYEIPDVTFEYELPTNDNIERISIPIIGEMEETDIENQLEGN